MAHPLTISAREISITASDGCALAATLYEPDASNDRFVLINSAMAVKRAYHHKFAAYLSDRGFTVLTYDYRGIGGSRPQQLRGFNACLRDWGAQDQSAMLDWITERYPNCRLLVVGHSVGGQILGLTPGNTRIAGFLGVAPQSGYWRLWPGWWLKARMLLLWYGFIPGLCALCGYFPGSRLGLGEDLPAGVALEWARGGRHRNYILDLYGGTELDHFAQFTAPMIVYSIGDDTYAPRPTVEKLLDFYPNASHTRKHIRPADLGSIPSGILASFAADLNRHCGRKVPSGCCASNAVSLPPGAHPSTTQARSWPSDFAKC